MNKRVCAAAVCAAFSLNGFAQSALDQARTAAGMAAIDRAQSTGFLAGLERGLKTPLEIVWLRAAAEESLWNDPALSRTTAVGLTAWRYVFGGNAQFAPRPNEIARLVVSTLKLPQGQGPINAGRLDLSGTGRLYLVTPDAPGATPPDRLAMILAAGSTLQISDATSPSIHIELKAPESRPLLLGNLAASDIGKVLSLLVKPGSPNAFEASVAESGKVALRAGGEVQLAALLPSPTTTDLRLEIASQPAQPIAPEQPEVVARTIIASLSPAVSFPLAVSAQQGHAPASPHAAADFSFIAASLESSAQAPGLEPIVVAALASSTEAPAGPASQRSPAGRFDVPLDAGLSDARIARVLEAPSGAERTLVASLAPRAIPPAGALAANPLPARIEPRFEVAIDSSPILSSVEEPAKASAERTMVASLAASGPMAEAKLSANPRTARAEAKADFATELSVVASAAEAKPAVPAFMQLAALAPASGALEFKAAAPAANPEPKAAVSNDLARMRAEVEAEIARERERLAAQFKPQVIGAPAPKRFVLGV